ncbi:unnamed protein product (macronuclear) [Paramecium tetraurelia]|uniref:Uncharacterized protein n=1 Tax=Paramecium tetraurelia TaxID=5888 RepID=A0D3K7_PARTE|nr:uncharacterized protein GSPATT00013112001 [Paramecium tetraurelia]CAK77624.1 unnamed protein product [Paramecium tetraurelia]|eukprot:XP_001445021.1 hypothetical protein (macronuclear) [Paramecium tetraurelia strain d4-2]
MKTQTVNSLHRIYGKKERQPQNQQTYSESNQGIGHKFKTSSGLDEVQMLQQQGSPNNYQGQKQTIFENDFYKKPFKPSDFKTSSLFNPFKRQSVNENYAGLQPLSENRVKIGGSKSYRFRKQDNWKLQNWEITSRDEEVKDDEIQEQYIDSQYQQSQQGNSFIQIRQLKQKEDELNNFIQKTGDEMNDLKNQIQEQEEKINILNKKAEKEKEVAKKMKDQISTLSQKNNRLKTQLLQQKLTIDQQIQKFSVAEQEISDKNDEIEKLLFQIKEMELKHRNLQIQNEKIEQFKANLKQQNQENEQLKEELSNLNQEKDNQNQIIYELNQQKENQCNINLEKDHIIIDLNEELENMKINFETQNQTIQELTKNYDQLSQNYDASKQQLNNEIKTKQNEIIDLQIELDVLKLGDTIITVNVKSFSTNVSQTFQMLLRDSISDLYILAVQKGIHKGSPLDCCLLVPSKNIKYASSEWKQRFQEIFIPNDYTNKTITLEFCQSS